MMSEQKPPDQPSLFSGQPGAALTHFIESLTDKLLLPGLRPLILVNGFAYLYQKDCAYFRSNRERRLEIELESAWTGRDRQLIFERSLATVRATRRWQRFHGKTSNHAAYTVFGGFRWARSTSPFQLLEKGGSVALSCTRPLERFAVARNVWIRYLVPRDRRCSRLVPGRPRLGRIVRNREFPKGGESWSTLGLA